MRRRLAIVGLAVLATVMMGCGGGGSGSPAAAPVGQAPSQPQPSTPNPGTVPPPPVTTTPPGNQPAADYSLQATVPAPTYAAGSPEAEIFRGLNAIRQSAGWGLMAQNEKLDAAARAHARYVMLNRGALHTETPGQPGYTGVNPFDRAKAAGYGGVSVGELIGGMSYLDRALMESYAVYTLTSVYHSTPLRFGAREIGIGVVADDEFQQHIVVLLVAFAVSEQRPAAGTAKIYPLDGQAGVPPSFDIRWEVPRPLPELTKSGPSVAVALDNVAEVAGRPAAETLISRFELRDPNGVKVPALLVTQPGVRVDPSLAADHRPDALLWPLDFQLIPKQPLQTNTRYTASFRATTGAATYDRTWSFTTGAR